MSNQDKPLVTFAVFAYNQEQFIREAIAGAFSQTYEPLEIILSDDCSSDRTFEIMQEMASSYCGKHQVRVRQNSHNIGTLDHLLMVAKEAKGQLLVVAAGDDVSLPHRTETLVNHWIKNPCHALCSGFNEIDSEGNLITENKQIQYIGRTQICYKDCLKPKRFENGKVRYVAGGTAAYDLRIFQNIPLSNQHILIEDAFTSHIINLQGGIIEWIKVPLVNYRITTSSITHFLNIKKRSGKYNNYMTYKETVITEKKAMILSQSYVRFCSYFFDLVKYHQYPDANQFIKNTETFLRLACLQSRYLDLNFFQKLKEILRVSRFVELKFCISRLFGVYFLWLLKTLIFVVYSQIQSEYD